MTQPPEIPRDHAELQQRAAELGSRYRALLDSIDEGFCIIEVIFDDAGTAIDYRFLETNPAFVQQTGLVGAVGQRMRELAPAHEAHWFERYGHVARTGTPTRFEAPAEALGRWYDVYAMRVDDPADAHVAVLFNDRSSAMAADRERERLLAALELERSRLASVFAQTPSVLAIVRGPDHVLVMANDAYLALNGHRDLLGKPLLEAVPELRGQGFERLLDEVVATGEPYVGREVPIWLSTSPGAPPEERYFDFVYLPLVEPDAEGAPQRVGVIAHGNDITEQVRARQDVERERERAEEANAAKSGFLATMSHELRTPINAIMGYAQLLELGLAGPLTDQQRGYLDRLAGSSQHLLGLVNDVLDLAKVEAGEMSVAEHEATTGPSIRAALDLVASAAAARGIRLVDERPDDEGVPFVGDEDRVRQIVLNLLSNAVKFTNPGGEVAVGCDVIEDASPAATHVQGSGPWAIVRVRDTGIGIAPEDQARLFTPFHQARGENAYTRQQGGTGLGLAISRRLARLMGGDLTAESTPGVGSTFTLYLPAPRDARAARQEPGSAPGLRAQRPLPPVATPKLGEVGELLREKLDEVLATYTDRLRADAAIPRARDMRRPQLEDHALSLLADVAQSFVIMHEAGPEAVELLGDGSAIQRVIADQHGLRRFAQGWDEAAVRRDHQVLREEIERVVRGELTMGGGGRRDRAAEDALRLLLGLIDRAEAISTRSWRRVARDRLGGTSSGESGGNPE